MFGKKKESDGVIKSVFIAYFILFLHLLLIAGIATLVLFFRGVINYIVWILVGGLVIVVLSALYFFRRMRAEGRTLREALKNPMFGGRSVEVSLLGGMATLRLGKPSKLLALDPDATINMPRLESPEAAHHREVEELAELARLLEKDLITVDEFNKAKQHLLNERKTL
jgi:hypothetical protein